MDLQKRQDAVYGWILNADANRCEMTTSNTRKLSDDRTLTFVNSPPVHMRLTLLLAPSATIRHLPILT
jgi:hypothetical protein